MGRRSGPGWPAVVSETVYDKVHDYGLWIRRTGLSEPQIDAIAAHVVGAPREIRDVCFEIADRQIHALKDRKLILRAETAVG